MPKCRQWREDKQNTHIGQLFYRNENAEAIFGDVDDSTETCRHRKKGCTFSVMLMLQQLNKDGEGGDFFLFRSHMYLNLWSLARKSGVLTIRPERYLRNGTAVTFVVYHPPFTSENDLLALIIFSIIVLNSKRGITCTTGTEDLVSQGIFTSLISTGALGWVPSH